MNFKKKRWVCLTAAFVLEMTVGISYIWSVLAAPIAVKYGWLQQELTFAFTLGTIATTLTSIFLGSKLSKHFSVRTTVLIGAALFGGGTLFAGLFLKNMVVFYFFQSIMRGMGAAFVYPVLVAYSQQLFPEKTGFGSGITTAGFGAGGIIWAPIATAMLAKMSIDSTMVILGVSTLLIIALLSFFLTTPPEEFKKEMAIVVGNSKKIEKSICDKKTKGMLRDPLFYFFFLVLCFGLAGGSMIISQARQIVNFRYSAVFNAARIGIIVSLISAGGAIGRFVFGYISDKMGRLQSLLLASTLSFVCTFSLIVINNATVFVILLIIIVLVYGGFSSMIAPVTGYLFGNKNVPLNYPVVFGAFGVASVIGPMSTSTLFDRFGGYTEAFIVAGIISLLGLIATILIAMIVRKRKAATIESPR